MKVALRYCKECNRKTIQAEDVYLDTGWAPTKVIPVWYCPNCGKQWQLVTKIEDELRG